MTSAGWAGGRISPRLLYVTVGGGRATGGGAGGGMRNGSGSRAAAGSRAEARYGTASGRRTGGASGFSTALLASGRASCLRAGRAATSFALTSGAARGGMSSRVWIAMARARSNSRLPVGRCSVVDTVR